MPEHFGVKKPKRNILVVDDERVLQKMTHTMLTRQGYSVLTANNGVAALYTAMRRPVDLVILDLMMPIMDGYQTLTMLRKMQHTRDIPVIILSANATVAAFRRVIQMGADDFISKPFRRLELLRKVAYLVRDIYPKAAIVPLRCGEDAYMGDVFASPYEASAAIELLLAKMMLSIAKEDSVALKTLLVAFERESESLALEKASHLALKMILALKNEADWNEILTCLESLYACFRTGVFKMNVM